MPFGQKGGSSVVQSVSGELVDNTDPKNPIIQRGAYFLASSTTTTVISTDPLNPSFLLGLNIDKSSDILLVDTATGSVRNDSGRTVTMTGTINFNPVLTGGGVSTLNLISERSTDGGATWTGNLDSRRTIEISNNGESFGTKLSLIVNWVPWQRLRFRAWSSGGGLSFESSSASALGQTFTSPSLVWELTEMA